MKVGDVVTYKFMSRTFKGVVTCVWHEGESCTVMRHNGETSYLKSDMLTRTGKHFDISKILNYLKED